jgi:hypothetical protein
MMNAATSVRRGKQKLKGEKKKRRKKIASPNLKPVLKRILTNNTN